MISKRILREEWEGVLSNIRQRTSEEKEILRDYPVYSLPTGDGQAFQSTRAIVYVCVFKLQALESVKKAIQ